jgi:hypothetical protein
MNYETRWLSRSDIFYVGLRAVRALMDAKANVGMFARPRVDGFNARIDDALEFTRVVHEVDSVQDPAERRRLLEGLGPDILARNEEVLYGGVMDQTYPVARPSSGRWCDELGWTPTQIEATLARPVKSG